MTLQSSLSFLSGLLTPIIAILAIYIGYKQYRIQRYKMKYDLYDRRFKVFERIKEFITTFGTKNVVESGEIGKFYSSIIEHQFLFDNDINEFIDEFCKKIEEFSIVCIDVKSYSKDSKEREELETKREQIRWWIMQELMKLPDRFEKYLSFKRLK